MADITKRKSKAPVNSKDNVLGLIHPFRPDMRVSGRVPAGTTVYKAIHDACKAGKIRKRLINYGIAQIGKRDYEKKVTRWQFIPFSQWKKHKLAEDELLRFRILPRGGGGGGGGKSILNTVLTVVVAIAAVAASVFTFGALGGVIGAAWSATQAGAIVGAGLAGMAVLTVGQALVNSIAPVAAPSLSGSISDRTQNQELDVYSISSGRNQVKQWGRVPVPVGRGRFAPPKGASPYTKLIGDDQYLHELLVIGIGDMTVNQIKIGSTPIEEYDDCLYEVMTYDPKNPRAPKYYPTGILEETLSIQLKAEVTNVRTTALCDYAEVDISFQGLCFLADDGSQQYLETSFALQYRESGSTGEWGQIGQSAFCYGYWGLIPTAEGRWQLVVNKDGAYFKQDYTLQTGDIQLGYIDYSKTTETGTWDTGYNEDYPNYQYVDWTRVTHHFVYTKNVKAEGVTYDGFDVWTRDGYNTSATYNPQVGWSNNTEGPGVMISSGNIMPYSSSSGGVSTADTIVIGGATTKLLRRTYTINFPKRGIYDVAITRISPDAGDTRVRNDSYWTALRSITNELPVKTNYPVMLLSLQIKASGQLSGAVDTLTVYYETQCYDYDMVKKQWVWQYTSNPAAIFRYILQQKDAYARPQPDSLLDFQSIQDAYEFCALKNFSYDKVMDSSISIFERLISICASTLSSPTMLDGKWGIIVDKPRTNVVCAFTSANAWQWSFERTQIRLPHAIHCNFINSETWDSDMRVVETDEKSSADYLYETQEYDGVTNPDQVWYLARFHYADAKRRRRTINFRAYDEAILCTRGDLVELACPNINVTGLQVGRIREVYRNTAWKVVAVKTDQINNLSIESGRRFGIRIYANDGQIYHAEIKPKNESARYLEFITPIDINIEKGDKYAFGDWSEEVFQAVVISMKFNSDWTCDITCQDYDPYIYGDLTKPVPEWKSIITKSIEYKWALYGTPIVIGAVSDEQACIKGADGSVYCRILIYVRDPEDIDPRAAYYQVQARHVIREDDKNKGFDPWWIPNRGISIDNAYVYIDDVDEGQYYQFRLRYCGASGEYGPWGEIHIHKVIGKTRKPPDVKNFKAEIDNPTGIKLSWDDVKVVDLKRYIIDWTKREYATENPIWVQPYDQFGLIEFQIVAQDLGGRISEHWAMASVTVQRPSDVYIASAQLLNAGITLTWLSAKTTWDINFYRCSSGGQTVNSSELEGVIPVVGDFRIGTTATVRAIDIFRNQSSIATSTAITVYYPQTPQITLGLNKDTGNITINWQDCKNTQNINAPDIRCYRVFGTMVDGGYVDVIGTSYESIVPLVVYQKTSSGGSMPIIVSTLVVKVMAIDKYGITNEMTPGFTAKWTELKIYPPYNPVNFGISATKDNNKLVANWTEATAILLTWTDCTRTFTIQEYVVYDAYTKTTYRVKTNCITLSARPAGQYQISVQAFDVLGQSSAKMDYTLTIGGVMGMRVGGSVDGADILLEWDTPQSSFVLDHYVIFEDNDDPPTGTNADKNRYGYLGEAKVNYFRTPAKGIGTFIYYVWAVDVAGNINSDFTNYFEVTVAKNPAPTVTAKLAGTGVELSWKINNKPANSLPVQLWEIQRWPQINVSQMPQYVALQDYGRRDTNKIQVDAFAVGKYSFFCRALDSSGTYGDWGKVDFNASAPGQVMFVNTLAIDNNVMLYWTEPNKIFFPIKEYLFDEIDQDTGLPMRIGSIDALFASESEKEAGQYTYAITPVDWGGNLGTRNSTTLRVSQPPDFIFYDHIDSLFNGTKTNLVLDGQGHMLGPVLVGETWNQQIARMKTLNNGTDITTWQQKINKGWTTWLEPAVASAVYVETFDHGAKIPGTNYSVTLGYTPLKGGSVISCKIETSDDNKNWLTISDNSFNVYASQFRYSRITIRIVGGFIQINNIEVNLDVKKQTDFGRVLCSATDNGPGWTSAAATPMLTGTWVDFAVNFVDVQSFPRPNVVTIRDSSNNIVNKNAADYTAYVVFEDVIYPKGFRCFVLDKNGNRVTAEVDWQVFGV